MIRPQVESNFKGQQDNSLRAFFDGKNKLSTDIDAKLDKLHLHTFRNYQIAHLDLESDAVVLTGPNGAGKTNVLEAISMLAPGRGLRRARREEIGYLSDQQQTETECQIPTWSVFADLNGPQGVASVGTGCLDCQPEGSRRAVKINGVNALQADLAQVVTVSWLTPQMDGLFIGSPSARSDLLTGSLLRLIRHIVAVLYVMRRSGVNVPACWQMVMQMMNGTSL